MFSYVREEDYALVNDDFKSLAYQYWNDRPSTPMTQMNPGATLSMGMMAGMAGMAGMMSGGMASAAVPNPVSKVEPWDCSCGKKQNTTKFCPECGMPK